MQTLNESFTRLSMRRRYEVWFLRLGLADGSGAWWFRYLLTSPGLPTHSEDSAKRPVQVWATWFPRAERPETWIQGFSIENLRLSPRGSRPFSFEAGENRAGEGECRGHLEVNGRSIRWDLRYRSNFRAQLSSKGWIGFSRTPHSDAVFSGQIMLDGRSWAGELLAYGMQGHNCGYRHRKFWVWTHQQFHSANSGTSTVEALTYEMPLGFLFRRAILWHEGQQYIFHRLQERARDVRQLVWSFKGTDQRGSSIEVAVRGRHGFIHHLPYRKTNGSGEFLVANDSLASASILLGRTGLPTLEMSTEGGAVLEMAGSG